VPKIPPPTGLAQYSLEQGPCCECKCSTKVSVSDQTFSSACVSFCTLISSSQAFIRLCEGLLITAALQAISVQRSISYASPHGQFFLKSWICCACSESITATSNSHSLVNITAISDEFLDEVSQTIFSISYRWELSVAVPVWIHGGLFTAPQPAINKLF